MCVYEDTHSFWVNVLGRNRMLKPIDLTKDNDCKQFDSRLLAVNDKHIQY